MTPAAPSFSARGRDGFAASLIVARADEVNRVKLVKPRRHGVSVREEHIAVALVAGINGGTGSAGTHSASKL